MQGRSVRLFLIDGAPTGMLTAEIMNWTGHVLVTPRTLLPQALKREEAARTGVYFLIGDDPELPHKQRVYVGEADIVGERLKSHAKDSSKDFWTRACIVTSKDTHMTKAHARFLESRLVFLAKQADRATIANGNEPGPRPLPEADISDMEFFIDQMKVVLPVVGFDFLREKPDLLIAPFNAIPASSPTKGGLSLVLANAKQGYAAKAVEVDGEITILAGSSAIAGASKSVAYGGLRDQLLKAGQLKPAPDASLLEFTKPVSFSSPSAAAAVVVNQNVNGRTVWRLAGSGQTLKEWQDAQLIFPEVHQL